MDQKKNDPAGKGGAGVLLGGEPGSHIKSTAQAQPGGTSILQGEVIGRGIVFAAVDPDARYTSPQICNYRFTATLAPYRTEAEARAALATAGAECIVEIA